MYSQYIDFIASIVKSKNISNFRTHPSYTTILEHVSDSFGKKYLSVFINDIKFMDNIDEFKKNDLYGDPNLCFYENVGMISPSTLRYIKQLYDLKIIFNNLDNMCICEVGCGYGGLARLLLSVYNVKEIILVDLPQPLELAKLFLSKFDIGDKIIYKTIEELSDENIDLFISNYAFTEISRDIQHQYLEKLILKSKNGYITYNDISPSYYNTYKLQELISLIPNSYVLPEYPLTHQNNCIITWRL